MSSKHQPTPQSTPQPSREYRDNGNNRPSTTTSTIKTTPPPKAK